MFSIDCAPSLHFYSIPRFLIFPLFPKTQDVLSFRSWPPFPPLSTPLSFTRNRTWAPVWRPDRLKATSFATLSDAICTFASSHHAICTFASSHHFIAIIKRSLWISGAVKDISHASLLSVGHRWLHHPFPHLRNPAASTNAHPSSYRFSSVDRGNSPVSQWLRSSGCLDIPNCELRFEIVHPDSPQRSLLGVSRVYSSTPCFNEILKVQNLVQKLGWMKVDAILRWRNMDTGWRPW